MSKRWLACVVLVISAWSSTALASLSSTPSPVNVGDVDVNTFTVATGTARSSSIPGDTLDHFTLIGAGCARFTVTPETALPRTITTATPMDFGVKFSPLGRGTVSCTVSFRDVNDASIGTDFTITGRGVAAQISAPALQAFSTARVDNAAIRTTARSIVIGNVGDANHNLVINSLTISGTEFTIISAPSLPATIAPGGTITVTIEFDPSSPGARTATLQIQSDDPVTPLASVTLTGTGTNAVIDVTDVAFGVVNLTQTSTQTIAVTNVAAAPVGPLRISSATITGGAGWFTFDANGFSCLGQSTCTFTNGVLAPRSVGVRCTPPAGSTGSMTATVAFLSDSDGGGDNVSALACEAGRADIDVDPTSLAYGNVGTGSTSVKGVTVTNLGNIDLTFTATKVGARQADYTFSGCFTSCAVPAGTSKLFTVSFTPLTAGAANITINLASNDPDTGVLAIPVTATAVAPTITAPATVAFGSVEVATTATRSLTITNSGNADLIISSADLTVNNGAFAVSNGATGAQTVLPGATAVWELTCTPNAVVVPNGRFTITSNASNTPTANVSLTCAGTEGILVVIPTSLDFGDVAENTVQTLPFRLRNTGNLVVSNLAATVAPLAKGYTLDPATPLPASLAPNAEVALNIRFAPLSGTDGGPASVTFSGTWGTGAKPLRTPPVLTLAGNGQATGFDTTVSTLDFGDIRFDAVVSRTFCIENTGVAAVQIKAPITVTPGAGTLSGEFAVSTAVKRQTTCGVGGVSQTLPQTLAAGELLEVTVTANPADRIGPLNATLTITSNLAVNPTRVVTLTGNSTSAGLTLAPGSTLDFGAVDVEGPPITRNVTITNSGEAPLDLASFARSDAAALNPHFTLTLPANTTLAAGESLTIAVTYDPAVVVSPADEITLTATIDGVFGGPTSLAITIRGSSSDREITVSGPPTFPDTFRNPGDSAPVRAITVSNTGSGILHITSAMLTSSDPEIWTLVDGDPVDIPGGASVDFLVRFAPKTIGPAPSATLVLTNDDTDETVVMIVLTGNGTDRNVAFGTMAIDVGLTGIGEPVTLDGALLVTSMDPENGFLIRTIAITGAAGFSVVDAPQNVELQAGATREFSIRFTPEVEGDFVATAELFLDKDPIPQATIPIRGRAVFLDAHGGGGCATGHGAGGGALLLVAVAMVALRRRRGAMGAMGAIALVALAPAAHADNVVLSVFDPTPATTGTNFQLQSPEVGQDGDWVLTANLSHATNPLVVDAIFNGMLLNDDRVVARSTRLELGGAYAFLGRFEAGARMPIYAQDGQPFVDSEMVYSTQPASGAAAGDLTLHGKVRLWRKPGLAVAGAVQLTLPTATDGAFTGVDKPSMRLLALAALVPDTLERRITLSANGGFVVRTPARYANLEQGSGFAWALGMSVRATDRVWAAAEVFGDLVPSGRAARSGGTLTLSPIEWLVGMRYQPDRRFSVGVAGGRGLTSAAGAPELRGVLAFAYAPGADAIRSINAPPPPKLDRDSDGDGVMNSVDTCPNEAEDVDLFDDTDGCPDLDNDLDGIADATDKCALDVEDKDNFQDDDGCPDKDNDNDAIADTMDTCPNEPEDRDQFQDVDGCPELDNDRDGIVDIQDKCVNEPEIINGFQDADGCPDPGDSIVVLSPDRIETLDAIQFSAGTKIAKPSFNVLAQIAATLRAHPEILRVRVTSHVHPTANATKDQELSDKRALAVRDWLVQWGIAARRVEMRGFGSTKPLSSPDQRGAAALNDRIELIILERK